MARYIRWQAVIAFSGIALVGLFLVSTTLSRTTVLVPDEGGIYVEGLVGAPQYVNPLLAGYNPVDRDLVALIFNGLTRMGSQGEVEPDLAHSWTVSPDGLLYTFRLRQDVRWSDGDRFDAADVVFTIGLLQAPDFTDAPQIAELWRTVTVQQVDAHTVQFRLREPFPSFLDYTTIGILPEHVLRGVSAHALRGHLFNSHPVGTGPFMLTDISPERVRLVPNPLHFRGQRPYLIGIEFRFYPSYERLLSAYRAGEVLGISRVPPHLFPEAAALDTLNLYSTRLAVCHMVYLNLQDADRSPFFQELRVRRALLAALDRQALIDQALNGQGLIADGPIPPWSWAYQAQPNQVGYDPAQAQTWLEQARWVDSDGDGIRDKEGRPLRFTLLTDDDPASVALGQAMARQWAAQGIAVTIEPVSAGLGERLRTHNFQAALAEVVAIGDPDLYPLWDQTQIQNGQNYGGWDNRAASEALEEARRILDREQRRQLYAEFQRIFAQEVPALFIAYPVYTYAVDQSVHLVQIGPLASASDRFRNIAEWYMHTRRVMMAETKVTAEATQAPARH